LISTLIIKSVKDKADGEGLLVDDRRIESQEMNDDNWYAKQDDEER